MWGTSSPPALCSNNVGDERQFERRAAHHSRNRGDRQVRSPYLLAVSRQTQERESTSDRPCRHSQFDDDWTSEISKLRSAGVADAACLEHPKLKWVGDLKQEDYAPNSIVKMLEICSTCPVRRECLMRALESRFETIGVWGAVNVPRSGGLSRWTFRVEIPVT